MKTVCEKCGGPLVLFTSLRYKECGHCNARYEWSLDKGQKPIFDETWEDDNVPPVTENGQDWYDE
jgi:hypothetical protein